MHKIQKFKKIKSTDLTLYYYLDLSIVSECTKFLHLRSHITVEIAKVYSVTQQKVTYLLIQAIFRFFA